MLVSEIGKYVTDLYNKNQPSYLQYHNLHHTEIVVQRVNEISANYPLDETEKFILCAAAWFHDTGHMFGEPHQHEERSASIMRSFLEQNGVEKDVINIIEDCILATKLPQHPLTFLHEILCDADTYNLGTKEFFETDTLLKRELELRNISCDNWREKTLNLLETHKFFTSYCKELLNKGKQENIQMVRSDLFNL